MIFRVVLLFLSFCWCTNNAFHAGDPIQKGFVQLTLKNYQNATLNFTKGLKRCPSAAAYGLARLYFVSKDMENIDSAMLYIAISARNLVQLESLSASKRSKYEALGWNEVEVRALEQEILARYISNVTRKSSSPHPYTLFLKQFPQFLGSKSTLDLRDSLWLDSCRNEGSMCYQKLLKISPQSTFLADIQQSMNIQSYKEWVKQGVEKEFQAFLRYHPNHPLASSAQDEIYKLISNTNDTNEFKRFIKTYPENENVNRIWKEFYQLSAGNYIPEKMAAFVQNYPDYPFKEAVISELEMFGKTLYPCVKDEYYGFMDETGMIRIPSKYDWVGEFKEGLAVVLLCDTYGVIDKKGQVHIPFAYQFISDFQEGVAIFQNENSYGLLNRTGKTVVKNQFEDLGWLTPSYLFFKKDSLFGVCTPEGEVVVKPSFEDILAITKDFIRVEKAGLFGVWNTKLVPVLPIVYDEIVCNEKGFEVTKGGKKGWIDFIGNPLIAVEFDAVGELSEGFVVVQKNQKFTHVNTQTWKVNAQWYDVFPDFLTLSMMVNGTFLVQRKSKFYWSDTLGKITKPLTYVAWGEPGKWVPVLKQKGGKWGFVDRKRVEMSLFEFDYVQKLTDVLYAVASNGKTGVISCVEGFVVPMEYEEIVLWNGAYLLCFKNEKRGIFTTIGTVILPSEYDMIQQFNPFTWVLKKGNEIVYFFPETNEFLKRKL